MVEKFENILGDNIGAITLIDHLGGDLEAVNGARASYGTESSTLEERDVRLLERLGRDQHLTPLRHVYVQVHVKAPEFIARQWYKHIVGAEYSFKDLPWSEFSQRYKEVEPEFYVPKELRKNILNNKQASVPIMEHTYAGDDLAVDRMKEHCDDAFLLYGVLIANGVAREQARLVLPLATYTEWTWTASIQACVHFCVLRDDPHAQWEIQQYAKALRELVQPLAPHTWKTLERNHPVWLQGRIKCLEADMSELKPLLQWYQANTIRVDLFK